MKKILYTDFVKVEDILKTIKQDLETDEKRSQQYIFKVFEELVSLKLKNFVKPVKITSKKEMIIACHNSSISSEIYWQKKQLLRDLNKKIKNLNIEILDIMPSCKLWSTWQ